MAKEKEEVATKRRGRKPLAAKTQATEEPIVVQEKVLVKRGKKKASPKVTKDVSKKAVDTVLDVSEASHFASLPKGFNVDMDSVPIAHFEMLDPRKQRFYFEERQLYCKGTEFSFEEIRGQKWKERKEREDERKRSQKLEEEVQLLRQQVALLLEMKQSIVPVPLPIAVQTATSATNTTRPTIAKEKSTSECKETFSALFNGTSAETEQINASSTDSLANLREPVTEPVVSKPAAPVFDIFVDETTKVTTNILAKADPKPKLDFAIFTDETTNVQAIQEKEALKKKLVDAALAKHLPLPQEHKVVEENEEEDDNMDDGSDEDNFPTDFSVAPGFHGQQEGMTFVLPKSETEFISNAHATSSTPAAPRANKHVGRVKKPQTPGPENHFGGGQTDKLSPIVETSREYKSSSSSSACSTVHTTRAMNKLAKWRMSREQETVSRKTLRESSQYQNAP